MSESRDSDVLDKADALMTRQRRSFVAAGAGATPAPIEDVPILTEVVDVNPAVPAARRSSDPLAALPPDFARALEDWLAAALPRLVARQLEGAAERIAQEASAALRDSLPRLMAELARNSTERTARD